MKTMQVLSMMLLLSACASKVEQESSVSFPIATPETPVQRAEVPDVKTMTQTPTPSAKVTVAPCKETPQPQATTAEIEAKIKEDLADFEWSDVLYENSPIGSLFANHQKESEYITITPHPTENQSVKGKEGTVFTFAPECFVDEIGNTVTTPIQLEIKECYGLADILSTNLTTTCNEQPIETAGMFYIQATVKQKGNNYYEEMMANFNENKYKIITTYSPQYADNYIFAVNRFGWGNCDMFSRDAGPKEMLTVKSEHTKNTDVKLLILKRNSILPSSPFNNTYRFSGIPRGTQAVIIATHVKNKKASFAFQPVTIGKEAVVTLTNFEEMSFADLEKKLLTL